MEACSTAKVPIFFPRCLFCFIYIEFFNHEYLCILVGVNINVMIQYKMADKADVPNSCAIPGALKQSLKCPKCIHHLWGFVFSEVLKPQA